jgi:hypothetical protein
MQDARYRLPRTPFRRTSEKAQKAKFAEFTFYEVG